MFPIVSPPFLLECLDRIEASPLEKASLDREFRSKRMKHGGNTSIFVDDECKSLIRATLVNLFLELLAHLIQ